MLNIGLNGSADRTESSQSSKQTRQSKGMSERLLNQAANPNDEGSIVKRGVIWVEILGPKQLEKLVILVLMDNELSFIFASTTPNAVEHSNSTDARKNSEGRWFWYDVL